MKIRSKKPVFSTPWFELVAKVVQGEPGRPYYSLRMPDYVTVLALTARSEVLVVRQYRPAVETTTLELPSGHVDKGETPLEACQRELFEETGFEAKRYRLMGPIKPDTGRLGNKLWFCLARDARPSKRPYRAEKGVKAQTMPLAKFLKAATALEFDHSLNMAVVFAAFLKDKGFQKEVLKAI